MMLDALIDENHIDIEPDARSFIKKLIHPSQHTSVKSGQFALIEQNRVCSFFSGTQFDGDGRRKAVSVRHCQQRAQFNRRGQVRLHFGG